MAKKTEYRTGKVVSDWGNTHPSHNKDPKYGLKVEVYLNERPTELIELLEAAAAEAYAEFMESEREKKAKNKKYEIKEIVKDKLPVRPVLDDDTNEPTGQYRLIFKDKAEYKDKTGAIQPKRIPVFDKKGKGPLDAEASRIYPGSEVEVVYYIKGWAMAATGKYGAKMVPTAIQVLSTPDYNRDAASFGFQVIDDEDDEDQDYDPLQPSKTLEVDGNF